ncbi:MAG: ADP-dependent NAD(P)H-hydrate dehydratase / NAD(P)H-hydrate epimerase [Thermoplasmata archaeon]|nr:ADP-dependent NAD(P)H-hydrate dehydratase / NAD(P)H-hydrate epimerase [Thermoplasmata archaeon]
MPKAIPWAEARRLDRNAAELGVPVADLMARAGKALAAEVLRIAPPGDIVLLCGKGNNGGDGLAAAALLQRQGRRAWAVLAEPRAAFQGPGAGYLGHLQEDTVVTWAGKPDPAWAAAPTVVDCLLGSGLKGVPRGPYASMLRWLKARKDAVRVACDLPSGLGTAMAVRPDATVTFHAPKEGMAAANAGRIVVADIGVPPAAADVGVGDLHEGWIARRADSHKGDNGVVLVVGGSLPLVGAPYYSAMAAYRTGADLVHCVAPADAAAVMRNWGPHAIVHDGNPGRHLTPTALQPLRRLLPKSTALLLGPGLGHDPESIALAHGALATAAQARKPTVVDADGLDALSPALFRSHGRRMVLTPHAREFLDLSGREATPANVQAYARRHGVVVMCKGVLGKGHANLVTDGARARFCRRGHPTLTVGGTGDVLAGITAQLLAVGSKPFEAAAAAAYLLGAAGEIAAALRGDGALATDVAEAIPAVVARLA